MVHARDVCMHETSQLDVTIMQLMELPILRTLNANQKQLLGAGVENQRLL